MGKNSPETNTDLACRQRDNKRRHRARQKAYIADLERRVADTREQGIQATIEVQLAARKVARENVRLKELLRRTGYTDEAIDAWTKNDRPCDKGLPQVLSQLRPIDDIQEIASISGAQKKGACAAQDICVGGRGSVPLETPDSTSSTIYTKPVSLAPSDRSIGVPCKLLTLLAENPAADITQVQLPAESDRHQQDASNVDDGDLEGVECSTAYKMMMQYATSEEKMDKIAKALENGCTPSATGGCKVKRDSLWTALIEECT